MINSKLSFAIAGLLALAVVVLALTPNEKVEQETATAADESFVIVELFTSEGCSSCPPADELLAEIVKNARKNNKPVYALAFHVDYWNRLGWKDIYSKAEYSERQREYARTIGGGVYTPEMIVNGKVEFVGSNESKARSAIENSLDEPAKVDVSISNLKLLQKDKLKLHYRIKGDFSDAVLQVLLLNAA